MNKPVFFEPDGNDLKKVMYYYGLDTDDKMVCPFHDDNHPSFHVNSEEGIFHCFACGASGDAFNFVKLANSKLDDLQQLRLYFAILKSNKVSKLKLSSVRKSTDKKVKDKKAEQQYELELSHDYYHGLRAVNWKRETDPVKDYMLQRGFTASTLNMIGAKLTITDKCYPIVFPIYDLNVFKGYVCRATNKRIEKRRKYLYNKGFSRNDTLCGNYNNKVVVLCEGYMDMLKLRQHGLKYVAAIFGWKITSKQVDKLKALGVKTVISALDMDGPGRNGTDYLKNFFDVVEFQFPKGVKDPGDLTKDLFDIAYKKTKRLFRSRGNI